ncbi:fused (3R)-hydroxyacyl-ACP dehydratase subunits HadA/HadB [Antrihabitans sp. YC2-6]|uniref:fused (3R)-hydroxyacyl-ACP dehydratase subunits HadA/HadB n=1 Tax=Antrihabitans sp. YC2-6 TaxID=2799498 RepID=UPI0018F6940B|nr:fused (3R)-hydroxyacyl-ACP dehydratase subunits HadA/HadB [Antrihabitans sp. YC2-6]MBJ8347378.1 MaoC family dehydratase N-terminal domain-containing protein [Antrihabitans sp. YC2-6]
MSVDTTTSAATAEATALVGNPLRLNGYYEVGREKIREFARAVQDAHPAHRFEAAAIAHGHDGLIAPVTFTAILGAIARRHIFENFMPNYDLSQVLHTEQRITSHRPVRAGDRLISYVTLEAFRHGHGQHLFVLRIDIVDEKDEYVQTGWTTIVGRAGGEGADDRLARAVKTIAATEVPTSTPSAGNAYNVAAADGPADTLAPSYAQYEPRPQRRLSEVAVGDCVPEHVNYVSRGDLVNYAGVSGDANPIHWSDTIVDIVGLPNVVAHGMLTMGLAAGLVTEWVGDPGAVQEFGVRFVSPLYVPSDRSAEVRFSGKVRAIDTAARTATVALTGLADGRKIFGRAVATVRLA